jgi:DNA-binding phage protein
MKIHAQAHPLLKDILEEAHKLGLNQKTIAQKAEMAPESLSRIIRTGKMELGTLERLAQAVGLSLFTRRSDPPTQTPNS